MFSFSEKLDGKLINYLAYFNYKNYVGRLGIYNSERVLEVGSGSGNLSRFLVKELIKGELVCVDNSEYWIKKAKERLRDFESVKFVNKDFLDFQESDFDRVVMHYVLHDIKDRERAVKILQGCLREKGIINVREPMRNGHGISGSEIEDLMLTNNFGKIFSQEGYSFPLRGKVYEGVFQKV